MARTARAEVEGGLYHVIVRGNNRRRIFDSPGDYEKLLALLSIQKTKLPFFLYAYCLMTNHVHLLLERQKDSVGHIMHRVLTGYSQYYNRRYQRVGHLLQGRHKAILCQSDRYLAELVRYIHLNPVRAKMVNQPEQYQYSSHRAYLGLAAVGIVDVEPVLRHFGVKKQLARDAYHRFVAVEIKSGHQERFYLADEGRILGTEEFVDATIHRLGESQRNDRVKVTKDFKAERLMEAVEKCCRVPRADFCGATKTLPAVAARELFVLIGCRMGVNRQTLSDITGLGSSTVSRRNDAAKRKARENAEMRETVARIESYYHNAE